MIHGKIISKSFKETQEIGRKIAKELKNGNVLALHGDLGAGKTTFVQGLAKGLGISQKIISPTFIIVRRYEAGEKNFYHIDLYRVESGQDIENLGILEILDNKKNIVAIEWPEKISTMLPDKRINIYFDYLRNDERSIEIK